MTDTDLIHMRRALDLAKAQHGRTAPNPAVGCVIVRDGAVLSEGATGDSGRPHAEETALMALGNEARGATAYVTLEPCGARSTGVPSCAQRLLDARVARVVYACDDPSPYASHIGIRLLKSAGISVEAGLMKDEAAALIADFVQNLPKRSL